MAVTHRKIAKRPRAKAAPHIEALNENINDVRRLLSMATRTKSYTEKRILRNGAMVLFAACWEAYIEDLADAGFNFLLRNSKTHSKIPKSVKRHVANQLKLGKDPLEVWVLAGDGWKTTLKKHKRKVVENWIGPLNNPNSQRVDIMFECLLGLKNLSIHWQWHGTSAKETKAKLEKYLTVRGQIAHRNSTSQTLAGNYVSDYTDFIHRLAVRSSNTVRKHLFDTTKKIPWANYVYKKTS